MEISISKTAQPLMQASAHFAMVNTAQDAHPAQVLLVQSATVPPAGRTVVQVANIFLDVRHCLLATAQHVV
jgi:hypothetical protein